MLVSLSKGLEAVLGRDVAEPYVAVADIRGASFCMNGKKAAAVYLRSDHLKYGTDSLIELFTALIELMV